MLNSVSKHFDELSDKKHQWSPWQSAIEYDMVQRSCPCGATMTISGLVLSKLDTPQQAAKYLEHLWTGLSPHVPSAMAMQLLKEQQLIDSFIATFGPGVKILTDTKKLEPPELRDKHMDAISRWLDRPAWDFPSTGDFWELYIVTRIPFKPAMTVVEGTPYLETDLLQYYTIIIRRMPVVLQDDRWWMEIAIRMDTGEPVMSVNHKGSIQDYLAKIQKEPF